MEPWLTEGKSLRFFLRFLPGISTQRDDVRVDFGNTVTTGTLSVKFISCGEIRGLESLGEWHFQFAS